MRKHLVAIAIICLVTILFFGCDSETLTSPSSVVASPENTAGAKVSPTVSENSTASNNPDVIAEETASGEYVYYLDYDKPVESPDSEAPLYYIHRMKKDKSGDENLNILCTSFDFAGQYLYTNTNVTYGDFGHWESYRYDLDGKGEEPIEYADMTRFSKGDRLYFSLFNESAFYSATTACTDVKKYEVKLPDDSEIREKLGYNYEVIFVTVTDENDGWVYFEFEVEDTGQFTYYKGNYRMSLESGATQKVDDGQYSLH